MVVTVGSPASCPRTEERKVVAVTTLGNYSDGIATPLDSVSSEFQFSSAARYQSTYPAQCCKIQSETEFWILPSPWGHRECRNKRTAHTPCSLSIRNCGTF